ncbi:cytochrome P450 [Polyporus arcularius HHB13444]|uniref:Cytochrome P450 n=1 Tax=Polyporus arcularius HHB13444 TaxID=1314778 RepID=A0A5C3PIW9_9APHY|nr:cytochrome P450 [Polyporus arcularius HHB13444]
MFPGPTPLPIVGNALSLPSQKVWIKLAEFAKLYGSIYALRLFGRQIVVLNSPEVARELLEGNSATVYTNRPLPKIIELAGFDKGVVLEHDLGKLRLARKLLHSVLQPKQMPLYREALDYHINTFLRNLSQDPDDFSQHIHHLTAGINIEVSHGYRVKSRDDTYVGKANVFGENFARATLHNGHIVNWLPFLAYLPTFLPGMGWKARARAWRDQYISLAQEGHEMVKDDIAKGTARPSLTLTALEESEPGLYPDETIMFTATQVYAGTSTSSILTSFVLLMVQYPETQKRAQDEIDRAIGPGRLPGLSYRSSLPYVDAIVTEVARLRPPIPILPRLAARDEVYNGCLIEDNAYVMMNFWAMLHDEDRYEDPHAFKPERWLGIEERDANHHPLEIVFGFGRRVCPGRYLAEETLFAAIARVLAVFNISHAEDSKGNPIIPSGDTTNGGITCPVPFTCKIRPRSPAAAELVQRSFEDVA